MIYKRVFHHFVQQEGSQHIAGEYALRWLEKTIKSDRIKTVFEFGIGIGTIPYLMYSLRKDIVYFGTENNDFCISAFKKHLRPFINGADFHHLGNYQDYTAGKKADLIIIDGEFADSEFLRKISHSSTIIFIEGDRKPQREVVRRAFPESVESRFVFNKLNHTWSPFPQGHYVSGFSVFKVAPTLSNRLEALLNKVHTGLKYRIRQFSRKPTARIA